MRCAVANGTLDADDVALLVVIVAVVVAAVRPRLAFSLAQLSPTEGHEAAREEDEESEA